MPDHNPWWMALYSDPAKAALAGAAGGLVRWITLRDNWKEGGFAVIVGMICAIYVSRAAEPVLVPTLSLITTEQAARDLVPFLMGIGGIGIVSVLIDVLKSVARSRMGGGGPDANA